MLAPAQEKFFADGDGRGIEFLFKPVGRQHFQFVGLFEHHGGAVPARQINPAGCANRGGVDPGQILEPLEWEGAYHLHRIVSRVEPDLNDGEVQRRVTDRIVESTFADLEARHVRWLIPRGCTP